jgi:GH24 family phage-related lysozyme (muramidase)
MAVEDLIARFEGYRAEPYWDYGQWSIGYGSYAGSRDRSNPPNITVSEPEARRMLGEQLGTYRANVEHWNRVGGYNWNPQQMDAMTSFAYNIGSIDQLTANGTRTNAEIADAMLLYNRAGGQRLEGLADRREAEHAVFTGAMTPEEAAAGGSAPPGTSGTGVGQAGSGAQGGAGAGSSPLPLHQNPATMRQLAEVRENNDWIENPLNQYEHYTYNLELFLVSPEDTINFFENVPISTISAGGWPAAGTKKVTIAQTGVTTEFNIDGLEVTTVAAGSSPEVVSGASTKLSFTLTQVGEVSMADSLKNATLIAGWQNLGIATFFVKITFKGFDTNGTPMELPNTTKVLPFRLSKLRDMSTEVDVSGTYIVLEGMTSRSSALRSDIDTFPDNIEFELGSTLGETVNNLIEAVNSYVTESSFAADDSFDITYQVEPIDSDFEMEFLNGNVMNFEGSPNFSLANNTRDTTAPGGQGTGTRIGILNAGSSVYDTIRDLMVQSNLFRNNLTSDSNTYREIPSIKLHYVPKPNGYNPVTNSQGAIITYYLSAVNEIIDQNSVDMARKVGNNATIMEQMISSGRLKKIYEHMYTGLNTEVINFRVSLSQQLIKAFSSFSDEYLDFTNLAEYSVTLDQLNENAQSRLDRLRQEFQTYNSQVQAFNTDLSNMQQMLATSTTALTSAMTGVEAQMVAAGISEERAQQILNQPAADLLAMVNAPASTETGLDEIDILRDIFSRTNLEARIRNQLGLQDAVTSLQDTIAGLEEQVNTSLDQARDILDFGLGASIQRQFQDAVGDIGSNFESLGVSGDFALLEELGNDIRERLSADEIGTLFNAMSSNPTTFRRISENWVRNEPVLRSTSDGGNPNRGVLARIKYNEGHQNDISMITAEMTIKGDPYWIENYATDKSIRESHGTSNFSSSLPNDSTRNVGTNYALIIENVPSEPDANDNMSIDNLFTWVYLVKSVRSKFENGLFTQDLDMVKFTAMEGFNGRTGTIGGTGVSPVPGDGQGDGTSVGSNTDGGLGEAVGEGETSGAGVNADITGDGTGESGTELVGGGRGDPRTFVNNGYMRSRDGFLTFVDAMTSASIPTAMESANYLNAYNEIRMAAAYGSSQAAADLEATETAMRETYGSSAQEWAEVINSDPSLYETLTPEFVASMNILYGTDVTTLITDPTDSNPIDASNIMTEIGNLDARAAMSVDEITANPSFVVRTFPDNPSTLDLSHANGIISGDIATFSPETLSGIADENAMDRFRSGMGTQLTLSENTLLARVEQEQLELLAETNGSYTALSPDQQAHYDNLVSAGEEIRNIAANDPVRLIAEQQEIAQELDDIVQEYELQQQISFDWNEEAQDIRLDQMQDLSDEIVDIYTSIPDVQIERFVVSPSNQVSSIPNELVPVIPDAISVFPLAVEQEYNEIPEEVLEDYRTAIGRYETFYNPGNPRANVTIEMYREDGSLLERWNETMAIFPTELAQQYGIPNPVEGQLINADSELYMSRTNGGVEQVMNQMIQDLPTLRVGYPNSFASSNSDLNTTRSGPMRVGVGVPQIIIDNEM